MEFVLNKHAEERIWQRQLPSPVNESLVIAKNKIKKQIRATCKKKGYQKDDVYWRTNRVRENGQYAVYVCKQIDIAKYIVITAFWLDK
jgi:hypothetical protein